MAGQQVNNFMWCTSAACIWRDHGKTRQALDFGGAVVHALDGRARCAQLHLRYTVTALSRFGLLCKAWHPVAFCLGLHPPSVILSGLSDQLVLSSLLQQGCIEGNLFT